MSGIDFADYVWDVLDDLVEAGHACVGQVPIGHPGSPISAPFLVIFAGGPLGFLEEVRLVGQGQIIPFLMNVGVIDGVFIAE